MITIEVRGLPAPQGSKRHVGNGIDIFLLDPSPRDGRADIGLVLVIGRDDLHLEIRVLLHEIFGGHFCRRDRSLAAIIGIRAGSVI